MVQIPVVQNPVVQSVQHQQHVPTAVVPCLPQYPVPPKQLNQDKVAASSAVTIKKIIQQQPMPPAVVGSAVVGATIITTTKQPVLLAASSTTSAVSAPAPAVTVSSIGTTSPTSPGGGICQNAILVKTRVALSACGTSLLRPEAAAHKVHNASRKPKDKVVEELWQHYVQCHAKDLKSKEPLSSKGKPYPAPGSLVNGRSPRKAVTLLKAPGGGCGENGVVKTVIEASGGGPRSQSKVVPGHWVGVVNDEDDN
jgi:hypothetical protein